MSIENRTKINRLVTKWPRGTIGAAYYLNSVGFCYGLLTKYKKSGWIRPFGRGAYKLAGDRVEWPGALYAIQTQLGLDVHAGGKTALEMKGYGHYLPSGRNNIFLYGKRGQILPAWFDGERLDIHLFMIRTKLFDACGLEGFTIYEEKGFPIKISAPERAAMEMLLLVPERVGFGEAFFIMENLVALRPEIVKKLLEGCGSKKVKRLFMYMAEKHDHHWLSKIDASEIDFGRGKRVIIKNGRLNARYQITVPRNHEALM